MSRFKYKLARVGKLLVSSQSEVYNPWKILAAVRVGSKVRVRNRGKCQEDASVTKTHCALTLALS